MAAKGLSTIGTKLSINSVKYNIKSYPDLFGTPDQIEITDEEDTIQKFVPGVKTADSMEFTMNYLPSTFRALKAHEGVESTSFVLDMGNGGKDGSFGWLGQYFVRVSGGEVNAPRDMVVTVFPETEIISRTIVYMSPPGPYSLIPGETMQIELVASDALSNVSWSVSDPDIISYSYTPITGSNNIACEITGVNPGETTLAVEFLKPENINPDGISVLDSMGIFVEVVPTAFTVTPDCDTVMIQLGATENLGVSTNRQDVTFEWSKTGSAIVQRGTVTGPGTSRVGWSVTEEDAEGDVTVNVKDPDNNVIFTKTWGINYVVVTSG